MVRVIRHRKDNRLHLTPEADLNWRIMRKAVLETMNSKVVDQHKPVQAFESAQLMYDLLVDPKVYPLGRSFQERCH